GQFAVVLRVGTRGQPARSGARAAYSVHEAIRQVMWLSPGALVVSELASRPFGVATAPRGDVGRPAPHAKPGSYWPTRGAGVTGARLSADSERGRRSARSYGALMRSPRTGGRRAGAGPRPRRAGAKVVPSRSSAKSTRQRRWATAMIAGR